MSAMDLMSFTQPQPQQVGASPATGPLDLRKRLAMQLMQQGSSAEPVQHWAQGAARVAQAVMGGLDLGNAERQEAEERKNLATALYEAQTGQGEGGVTLGQGGRAAALARVLGSPYATPGQTALAQGMAAPVNSQIITRPDGSVYAVNPRTLENRQLTGVSANPPEWGVVGQNSFGEPQYGFINRTTQTITRPGQPAAGAAPAVPAPAPMSGGSAPAPAPAPAPVGGPPAATAQPPAPTQQQPAAATGLPADWPPGLPPPPPGVSPRIWREQYSQRQAQQSLPASGEDEARMRGEVGRLPSVTRVQTAVPIFNSMVQSAGQDSTAADLDFVYGLAKIFDPESVVREGEMTMVRNTGSIPQQIMGYINQVTQAGQRLTPEQRSELLAVAQTRVGQLVSSANADVERFRGIATSNRANPANILPSMPSVDEAGVQQFRQRFPGRTGGTQQPGQQAQQRPGEPTREDLLAEMRRRGIPVPGQRQQPGAQNWSGGNPADLPFSGY